MLDHKAFKITPPQAEAAATAAAGQLLPAAAEGAVAARRGTWAALYRAFALGPIYRQRFKQACEAYGFVLERGLPYLNAALEYNSAAADDDGAALESAAHEIEELGGWPMLSRVVTDVERANQAWEFEVHEITATADAAWRKLAGAAMPGNSSTAAPTTPVAARDTANVGANIIKAIRGTDPVLRGLRMPELARELQKRAQHRLLISAARACERKYPSLLDARCNGGRSRSVASPLRYMGGKSRAVDLFLSLIPHDTETICAPFFGGGSVELAAAECGVRVFGYDAFPPLVNFWQRAIAEPAALAAAAERHFPPSKERFYDLQRGGYDLIARPVEQAAAFFFLNRASFGGGTFSSGMSAVRDTRFTRSAIERLRNFKIGGLSVDEGDFADTILRHRDGFLFLDPPYLIDSHLYGKRGSTHRRFDHGKLWDMLLELRDRRWVLCYDDGPLARDLYAVFETFSPVWTYGMGRRKQSRELLILSDPVLAQLTSPK